jgi:hypothetical protein
MSVVGGYQLSTSTRRGTLSELTPALMPVIGYVSAWPAGLSASDDCMLSEHLYTGYGKVTMDVG